MIKKAPKDMTANELVNHLIDRLHELGVDSFTEDELIYELNRPAPNPFTPDQIAWMREEQRAGFMYAWKDASGYAWCSVATPSEKVIEAGGWECAGCHGAGTGSFLRKLLSANDPEPLCFADYAPLEGADHV